MNKVRRLAGLVWIALAVAGGYYLIVNQAIPKFKSGKTEDIIPATIYAFILTPVVSGGLLIFGRYALAGEYDR